MLCRLAGQMRPHPHEKIPTTAGQRVLNGKRWIKAVGLRDTRREASPWADNQERLSRGSSLK